MDPLLGAIVTIDGKRVTVRKVGDKGLLVRHGFNYYWTFRRAENIDFFIDESKSIPVKMFDFTVDLVHLANTKIPIAVGTEIFLPAMDLYARMGLADAMLEYPEFEKSKATVIAFGERGVIVRYDAHSSPFFLSRSELEDCMVSPSSVLDRLLMIEPGVYCFITERYDNQITINKRLIDKVQDNPIRPLDFLVHVEEFGWLPRTRIVLDVSDFAQPRTTLGLKVNEMAKDAYLSLNCRFFFSRKGRKEELIKWDRKYKLRNPRYQNEVDRVRFQRLVKIQSIRRVKYGTSIVENKRGHIEVV